MTSQVREEERNSEDKTKRNKRETKRVVDKQSGRRYITKKKSWARNSLKAMRAS